MTKCQITGCRLAVGAGLLALITLFAGSAAFAVDPKPQPAKPTPSAVGKAVDTVGDDVADGLLGLKVHAALLDKLGVDGLRVSVKASNGQVTLAGEVKQKATAAIAEDVAKSVSGVKGVHESIQVKPAPADAGKSTVDKAVDKTQAAVNDAIVETRVKVNLVDKLGRTGFAIEVNVTDGVVSLVGKVAEKSRRDEAGTIAGKTEGVKKVVDLLKEK